MSVLSEAEYFQQDGFVLQQQLKFSFMKNAELQLSNGFTNPFLFKSLQYVQQEKLPSDISKLTIPLFIYLIIFKGYIYSMVTIWISKILTGHGDWRNKVTFSSSSMSCKKSLLINPEMFPEVGRFPRWGEDWNNSQRTWECKMTSDWKHSSI